MAEVIRIITLEYNPAEDSILSLGEMTQARDYHAVSVVQVLWCQ